MNQRTVLGILLVFVLTTFTQCTVQKRLYRKGYYISFHKTPKSSGEPKEEKQLADLPAADTIQTTDLAAVELEEVEAEISESTATSDAGVDEATTTFGVKANVAQLKENAESLVKQVISKAKDEPEPTETKKPRHARTAIIAGMILLFFAGVGLIFLGIATLDPIPVVFGALISLGAVVGMFIGLAVEDAITNKDKVAEEKKAKKEKEQKLSEEEWGELKEKQYQKAVRTTILLVVLFFGISLFAIAVGEPMPLIVITGAMFLIFLAFVWGTYKQKRKDDPVMDTES